MIENKIIVHKDDLPDDLIFKKRVGIDTETTGLSLTRDRLCLVQLMGEDEVCHLVKFNSDYTAKNLKKLLIDEKVTKIFHFARFDLAMFKIFLGIDCNNIFCTKIASMLVRTYTQSHGLREVCRELIGVTLDKEQQSSDWAIGNLSKNQLQYAASDVIYLAKLMDKLTIMLKREGRYEIALECFKFLSKRVDLDIMGFNNLDIFAHSMKKD